MKKFLLISLLLCTALSFNVKAEEDEYKIEYDKKGCLIIKESEKKEAEAVLKDIDINGDGCLQKNEVDKYIDSFE